jgi:dTDP-4-amino-4,6-dideoxygalactose transaminase
MVRNTHPMMSHETQRELEDKYKSKSEPKRYADPITEFENRIADFFGAPYAVAVDSCTHGLELCLRYTKANVISVPNRTYLSVPMLANKLGIGLDWFNIQWQDLYYITNRIIDAAVLWKANSYRDHTFMCLSFQYQKHLSLGRGGMILCPDLQSALALKKMSYDGRLPGIPWREQDIDTIGYHYYMTPETAQLGLDKLQAAIDTPPRKWVVTDWPALTQMKIFKK